MHLTLLEWAVAIDICPAVCQLQIMTDKNCTTWCTPMHYASTWQYINGHYY